MVGGVRDDPAAIVASRASVRLALIAALQHLPPRQRAVLVLRDVLAWRAAEVAEALGTTTVAVNSTLQRARAQLDSAALDENDVQEPSSPEQRELLDRYVRALQDKDVSAIVQLFTADAVWEMPPFTAWYEGPEDIGRLIAVQCPAGPGELRLVPTAANGQPAYAVYMLGDDGDWHAFQLQVLTLARAGIAHVSAFFDLRLFAAFGLPQRSPARALATPARSR